MREVQWLPRVVLCDTTRPVKSLAAVEPCEPGGPDAPPAEQLELLCCEPRLAKAQPAGHLRGCGGPPDFGACNTQSAK
jgi:hypothetical protein